MNNSIEPIKVSVLMITYNHEKYISQAVDSVLMQQADFKFELVIGEDCSLDRTREILLEYKMRYPDKIRLLLSEKNIGAQRNLIRTYEACRGNYIALLEGDDYLIDPNKLQNQADYLDEHYECATCFHNVLVVNEEDEGKEAYNFCPPNQRELFTIEDLLLSTLMQTSSMMFRRGLVLEFPDWFYTIPLGDWTLNIINAQYGKIGYIDKIMSVYRKHSEGIWSGQNKISKLKQTIETYEVINKYLNFKYDQTIRKMITFCYYKMALEHYLAGSIEEARFNMSTIIENYPLLTDDFWKNVLETAWRLERRYDRGTAQGFITLNEVSFDILPEARQKIRALLGEWHAAHSFSAFEIGDYGNVVHEVAKAVMYDRKFILNRGIASILFSAIFRSCTQVFLNKTIKTSK